MGSAPDRLASPGPAAGEAGGSGEGPLEEHGPTNPMPPIQDARPWWQRYGSGLGRPLVLLWRWLLARFAAPPLTSYLPRKQDLRGERILDSLYRVPRAYLPVIARVAGEVEQMHETYPGAVLSSRVHMAVSRACADEGRPVVPLAVVLGRLGDLHWLAVMRSLRDLEEVGLVRLLPPDEDAAPGSRAMIDKDPVRGETGIVELLRSL
jgi:hypothetical protein